MRKHWDECPGVFCLGEVAKDYLSPARGIPRDEGGVGQPFGVGRGDPSGQTGYISGTMSLQTVTVVGIGGSPLR